MKQPPNTKFVRLAQKIAPSIFALSILLAPSLHAFEGVSERITPNFQTRLATFLRLPPQAVDHVQLLGLSKGLDYDMRPEATPIVYYAGDDLTVDIAKFFEETIDLTPDKLAQIRISAENGDMDFSNPEHARLVEAASLFGMLKEDYRVFDRLTKDQKIRVDRVSEAYHSERLANVGRKASDQIHSAERLWEKLTTSVTGLKSGEQAQSNHPVFVEGRHDIRKHGLEPNLNRSIFDQLKPGDHIRFVANEGRIHHGIVSAKDEDNVEIEAEHLYGEHQQKIWYPLEGMESGTLHREDLCSLSRGPLTGEKTQIAETAEDDAKLILDFVLHAIRSQQNAYFEETLVARRTIPNADRSHVSYYKEALALALEQRAKATNIGIEIGNGNGPLGKTTPDDRFPNETFYIRVLLDENASAHSVDQAGPMDWRLEVFAVAQDRIIPPAPREVPPPSKTRNRLLSTGRPFEFFKEVLKHNLARFEVPGVRYITDRVQNKLEVSRFRASLTVAVSSLAIGFIGFAIDKLISPAPGFLTLISLVVAYLPWLNFNLVTLKTISSKITNRGPLPGFLANIPFLSVPIKFFWNTYLSDPIGSVLILLNCFVLIKGVGMLSIGLLLVLAQFLPTLFP